MNRVVSLRNNRSRRLVGFAVLVALAFGAPLIDSKIAGGGLLAAITGAPPLADARPRASPVTSRGSRETIVIARCGDGDTCTAASGEKLRLLEIDAPELGGARCGRERALAMKARDRLSAIVAGKRVQIERGKRDQWGRGLVRMFVDSEDVGSMLMREGLAVSWRPGLRNERPGPWCGG